MPAFGFLRKLDSLPLGLVIFFGFGSLALNGVLSIGAAIRDSSEQRKSSQNTSPTSDQGITRPSHTPPRGGRRAGALATLVANCRNETEKEHCGATAIKDLLAQGADPNARHEHNPVLVLAIIHQFSADSIRELVRAGADVNRPGELGRTALMVVAERGSYNEEGNVADLETLIAAGANVDAQNNDGWTALMIAGGRSAEVLLRAGADVTVRNRSGQTALDLAEQQAKEARDGGYADQAAHHERKIMLLREALSRTRRATQ